MRLSARLWQMPVLQAHPPQQSPESCPGHWNRSGGEGPDKPIHHQMSLTRVWFLHMNGYKASGSQYKEASAKLTVNLTGNDLWLFVQGLKGSLSIKSLMQSSIIEPFHPSPFCSWYLNSVTTFCLIWCSFFYWAKSKSAAQCPEILNLEIVAAVVSKRTWGLEWTEASLKLRKANELLYGLPEWWQL